MAEFFELGWRRRCELAQVSDTFSEILVSRDNVDGIRAEFRRISLGRCAVGLRGSSDDNLTAGGLRSGIRRSAPSDNRNVDRADLGEFAEWWFAMCDDLKQRYAHTYEVKH